MSLCKLNILLHFNNKFILDTTGIEQKMQQFFKDKYQDVKTFSCYSKYSITLRKGAVLYSDKSIFDPQNTGPQVLFFLKDIWPAKQIQKSYIYQLRKDLNVLNFSPDTVANIKNKCITNRYYDSGIEAKWASQQPTTVWEKSHMWSMNSLLTDIVIPDETGKFKWIYNDEAINRLNYFVYNIGFDGWLIKRYAFVDADSIDVLDGVRYLQPRVSIANPTQVLATLFDPVKADYEDTHGRIAVTPATRPKAVPRTYKSGLVRSMFNSTLEGK